MPATNHEPDSEIVTKSLLDLATESWRFGRVFERVLARLDAGEKGRYQGQFQWFRRRVEDSLRDAGMQMVNVEGQPFEPGVAATPLNIADFQENEALVIDQMLEPIIMGPEGVVRTGTVTLRRART